MNSLPRRTLKLACVTVLSVLTIFILSASRAQAGVLDTTFGSGGGVSVSPGFYDSPSKVFVLPNGKILVAGVTAYAGFHQYAPSMMMVRFNSDGTVDSSFGSSGIVSTSGASATVNDIIMQPDGKIVFVGGLNPGWNYPPLDFAVARFNSDGSRDSSFGNNGNVGTSIGGSYDSAGAVVYLPDGKLMVAGYTSGTSTSPGAIDLVRYNSDGSLDQTFGEGGILYYLMGSNQSTPYVYDMILQSDGKLFVNFAVNGGVFGQTGGFARFNPDGSFDNTYGTNGILSTSTSVAGKMTVQSDGKIIIPVSYSDNNIYQFAMYRYNSDGTLDTSFGTNGLVETPWRSNFTGFADASARDAAIKSNGDIVLVGSLVRINGQVSGSDTSAVGVALYASNGTLIAKTAVAFPPYQSYGTATAVQPDGKILAAGYSSNFYTDVVVARLTNVTNDARRYKRFFDFNGDLYTDLMIYRPGVGSTPSVWYNFGSSYSPAFGQEGDIITPADYNDDGVTDIAVFRPSTGTWYIASNNDDPINHFTAIQWGQSGDIPVAGDYDGDGKADVGVFRPSNGYWYILYSSDNTVKIVPFGVSGDKPVVGDYDGDGRCDIAVFRPSNGTWYVANIVTGEYTIVQFGANGDIPAQNDYNGDGKTDMVVFRPSTGIWYTSTDPAINYGAVQFGRNGDIPVVGDYDADGKADIAVWRPTNRSWYVRRSTNGSVYAQQWGASTDIPVPGN
jgi:uncharacterized delta-60 repeat protein